MLRPRIGAPGCDNPRMLRKLTRAGWPVAPLVVLLAIFACRGAGCRHKSAPAVPEVTPASKHGWITPLLTAPPPQPSLQDQRSNITPVPTLPG